MASGTTICRCSPGISRNPVRPKPTAQSITQNQAARQAEERLAYDEAVDFYDAAINACRADEPVDQGLLAELL